MRFSTPSQFLSISLVLLGTFSTITATPVPCTDATRDLVLQGVLGAEACCSYGVCKGDVNVRGGWTHRSQIHEHTYGSGRWIGYDSSRYTTYIWFGIAWSLDIGIRRHCMAYIWIDGVGWITEQRYQALDTKSHHGQHLQVLGIVWFTRTGFCYWKDLGGRSGSHEGWEDFVHTEVRPDSDTMLDWGVAYINNSRTLASHEKSLMRHRYTR